MKWVLALLLVVVVASSALAKEPCPEPNPNLLGPGHFQDGCALPAAGLNLAAPLDSPAFTGTITVNGSPLTPGGGNFVPGGAVGQIQVKNSATTTGGYTLSPAFSTTGGVLDIVPLDASRLAPQAACFNLGAWRGDLQGAACSDPVLSPGAAPRNLGPAPGAISGTWPNLSLVKSGVFAAIDPPGGDLGGTSYASPIVVGFQGYPLCKGVAPAPQSALVWTGSCYMPQVQTPGIVQLTGDGLAGPPASNGMATLTIQPNAVTNIKLAQMAAGTIKAQPGTQSGPPQDITLASSLAFTSGGALGLSPTLGTSQQYSVTAGDCLLISDGIITNIAVGTSCSTGNDSLLADDGVTPLWADDGATALLVDGTQLPTSACTAWQTDFSVATGCNLPFLLFLKI